MVKRKGLPEMNELVMCTVKRITPYAAWCYLDEYGIEGMIHISEAAGRLVHDIREFVKSGKQYVAKVVKIEADKNIVNLSLKRVSKKDEKDKLNSYRRAQQAEKLLEMAARTLKKNIDEAYEEAGFLLQDKFGELFIAFEEARREPDILEKSGVPKRWAEALLPIINKAIKEKETLLKFDINMISYEGDGVERIKQIVSELEKVGLKVSYISAPRYMAELVSRSPKEDEKRMLSALESLAHKAKQSKVEFGYKLVK
jgi:translation initiation factor 2 subunit 1